MSLNHKDGSQDLSVTRIFQLNRKSKKSASKVESVSKFFTKTSAKSKVLSQVSEVLKEDMENSIDDTHFKSDSTDSPYKNLLKTELTTKILNDSSGDAADFRSPFPSRKPNNSKLSKLPVQKNTSKVKGPIKQSSKRSGKKSSKSSKSSAVRVITDHFKYFGENPEHMQMAMALSKSTYEAECGLICETPPEDNLDISEILRNSKPTFLERFGFTSKKRTLPVENRSVSTSSTETTMNTRNRFKYITPILNIRTSKERESMIDSKISLILSQKAPYLRGHLEPTVVSNSLNNCISKERSVFNLDHIYQTNNFYVKCLGIPRSTYKCGYLLKDWSSIPGRDKSPCKTEKYTATGDPGSYKNQVSESLISRTENAKEITLSRAISEIKENPVCIVPPVKNPNEEHSFRNVCNASTEVQKIIVGSLSTESKDSKISSFASSAKTINSFTSSVRSTSPDLFGSDDKTDQFLSKTENAILEDSFSPNVNTKITQKNFVNVYEENIDSLCKNSTNKIEISLNSDERKCKSDDNLKKNDNSALPTKIIDLTDDDDNVNECSYKSIISGSTKDVENNDCCVNTPVKVQNRGEGTCGKRKPNIYDLTEFEADDSFQMELSSGSNLCEDIARKAPNSVFLNVECVSSLSNQTNDCSDNEYNQQIEFLDNREIACIKTGNVNCANHEAYGESSNVCHSTKIVDDEIKQIDTEVSINDSHNESNKNDSAGSNVNLIDQNSLSDSYVKGTREQTNSNSDANLNETPKGNQSFYSQHFVIDANNFSRISNTHSTPEGTPKRHGDSKCVKSPYFDEPMLYDSADLNVTEYVNNILSQENVSFSEIKSHDEVRDKVHHNANNEEEMSSSQGSQSSAILLDEELNYSSHFATPLKVVQKAEERRNYSNDDDIEDLEIISLSPEFKQDDISLNNPEIVPKIDKIKQISTPGNFIIKTDKVTPMPEYDKMTTPLINKELHKVGVKPLKRKRGITLLKYIYESTHPFIGSVDYLSDNCNLDGDKRVIKKRKKENEEASVLESNFEANSFTSTNSLGDRLVVNEADEDLIFERKQSTKIPSCKVPLQIAWHNLVSSQPNIKENILLYEPLQLESLHMMLKEQGFKFHIQDLLTFLDKKCITIRTAQKQGKIHR